MLRGSSWLLPHDGFHYLCVASASFIHRPAHVQSQRLLPLRNWSSTLLCACGDLCAGLAECSLASKAPLPIAPHSVLMLLTSCMTSYSLCCRGILHARAWFLVVVSLRGGPTSAALRASGMVRGGIQIPCCTLDSERLVWHSIAQCARPVACIGRNGNLVSHHSLSLSLDWQLPSSATLSVAQLIHVATNQIT